jgi:hypothetical protein
MDETVRACFAELEHHAECRAVRRKGEDIDVDGFDPHPSLPGTRLEVSAL